MESAERHAALERVLEGFVVGADRILEVHGLRLPKHLAYAIGWWHGMSDDERRDAEYVFSGTGATPCGIGAWLGEGRFDRVPELARWSVDPPELLSVFGDIENGRLALWYDDPARLPGTVVHADPYDVIEVAAPTLLDSLGNMVVEDGQNDPFEGMPEIDVFFEWMSEVGKLEKQAYEAEAIRPFDKRDDVLDGVGPWIEGWTMPAELAKHGYAQYEDPTIVKALVATAREKLATEPGWALVIGRNLRALQAPEQHALGTELLVAAYRALGRDALAAIA